MCPGLPSGQIGLDRRELLQGGLEILDDVGGDDVRAGRFSRPRKITPSSLRRAKASPRVSRGVE